MILFCITFLFVFGWKITAFVDVIPVLSATLACYAFVALGAYFPRSVLHIALALCALSAYALLIVTINGAMDMQIALRSIRATINFMGGAALVALYFRAHGESFVQKICLHLYGVLVLHAILMIAMYLYEPLRLHVYALASTYSYVNLNYPFIAGLRTPGLTYGLSQTSVLQMCGLMLFPVVVRYWAHTTPRLVLACAGVPTVVVSIFLSGRSGLLLGIFLVPMFLWLAYRFTWVHAGKQIILTSILLAAIGYLMPSYMPPSFERYNLAQAHEVIEVFSEWGQTPTTKNLAGMYFLPSDVYTFLFGSSNLGRGSLEYIPSDAGYVRILFAIGVPGSLLMLVPFAYGMWRALSISDRILGGVTFVILLASIALNFKELALLTRNMWSLQSMLLCACFFSIWNHKELREAREQIPR